MVFIDFAKAFDTVSHRHMLGVLERRGVHELIRRLVRDSYRNCTTTIKTEGGETDQIRLEVGVKRGDPMSPLLFKLAIDPLLYKLDETGQGL